MKKIDKRFVGPVDRYEREAEAAVGFWFFAAVLFFLVCGPISLAIMSG